MSYGIHLFHPSVKAEADRGHDLDAFPHAPLDRAAVNEFVKALDAYGYVPESQSAERRTFSKAVGDSSVVVSVYDTQIAFSVAGGDPDALFEALQDAAELCDYEKMVLFDPQTGEWEEG